MKLRDTDGLGVIRDNKVCRAFLLPGFARGGGRVRAAAAGRKGAHCDRIAQALRPFRQRQCVGLTVGDIHQPRTWHLRCQVRILAN